MKKNVGLPDALVRILAALAIIGLYVSGFVSGIVGVILIILAIIFVGTAFVGFCPLYLPFRFSTRKKDEA